jgi:hypothetical protein
VPCSGVLEQPNFACLIFCLFPCFSFSSFQDFGNSTFIHDHIDEEKGNINLDDRAKKEKECPTGGPGPREYEGSLNATAFDMFEVERINTKAKRMIADIARSKSLVMPWVPVLVSLMKDKHRRSGLVFEILAPDEARRPYANEKNDGRIVVSRMVGMVTFTDGLWGGVFEGLGSISSRRFTATGEQHQTKEDKSKRPGELLVHTETKVLSGLNSYRAVEKHMTDWSSTVERSKIERNKENNLRFLLKCGTPRINQSIWEEALGPQHSQVRNIDDISELESSILVALKFGDRQYFIDMLTPPADSGEEV